MLKTISRTTPAKLIENSFELLGESIKKQEAE